MSQEQKYQNYPYVLTSRGLVARFVNDRLPDHTYINLKNVEVREENAISLRFGHIPLTVSGNANNPLTGAVNTLGRLKSLGIATYRYASAGGSLYRRFGDTPGVWNAVASGLSTKRCSMVSFTPPFSSYPYLYIADALRMLADNGGVTGRWGILWPQEPLYAKEVDASGVKDVPILDAGYTYSGVGAHALATPVLTSAKGNLLPHQLSSLTLASITGIVQGCFVSFGPVGGPIGGGGAQVQQITGINTIWFQPDALAQYALGVGRNTIHYVTNASPSYIQSNFSGNTFDFSPNSLLPVSIVIRINVANPGTLTTFQLKLSTGTTGFTDGYTYDVDPTSFAVGEESIIVIPISSLTPYGAPDIHAVKAFRLITTQGGAVTADYYSLNLDFAQGPTILAGVPYDYLYTFWDANTGEESGPSPFMLQGGLYPPVSLFYGPILLHWDTVPFDVRATHIRIYRRGGTLPSEFHMIAQIPAATFPALYDNMPDNIASTGALLNIDNYPPITSTLPQPVNTGIGVKVAAVLETLSTVIPASMANISVNQRITIGSGSTQETVTVVGTTLAHFTAYLQFNHEVAETVYAESAWAQPANIAQTGFGRMFVGGDSNNPARLYYSDVGLPSNFGVENFIDLGDTTDPIKGITPEAFGRLYVFTLGGAVYQIISVNGSTPVSVRTNATHGMFAHMAFTVLDQGIPYLSNDGIYLFTGGTSAEVSQLLQWVFRQYAQANGPLPVMDLTRREEVCFGFFWDECFVSYLAVDGKRYRVIYSARDNRWRNDDISASAMNYEKDTAALIYGDDTGMVYQDRVGNTDMSSPVTSVPINFELTTASLDQGQPKNPKVYTELTVDINTRGQDIVVKLLSNFQKTVAGTFVVNTTERTQVQFKVNNGLGYSSLNTAFDVSGSATDNVDIFELHLKALVDAELRKSSDTFWTRWGTEQWKVAKQMYAEYTSNAPVVFGVYQEGNATTPAFTFTLPSTNGVRTVTWVRFPATKAKNWRIVGVCDSDFQLYESSFVEVKALGLQKGYTPHPLVM